MSSTNLRTEVTNTERAVTGIEVYSSIRRFHEANQDNPSFLAMENEHLRAQIDNLVEQRAQDKQDTWLLSRQLGVATASIVRLQLGQQHDALLIQSLREETAALRRDIQFRGILVDLKETRRNMMVGSNLESLPELQQSFSALEARVDLEYRRLEQALVDNQNVYTERARDIIEQCSALTAEIAKVPHTMKHNVAGSFINPDRNPFEASIDQDKVVRENPTRASSVSSVIDPVHEESIPFPELEPEYHSDTDLSYLPIDTTILDQDNDTDNTSIYTYDEDADKENHPVAEAGTPPPTPRISRVKLDMSKSTHLNDKLELGDYVASYRPDDPSNGSDFRIMPDNVLNGSSAEISCVSSPVQATPIPNTATSRKRGAAHDNDEEEEYCRSPLGELDAQQAQEHPSQRRLKRMRRESWKTRENIE